MYLSIENRKKVFFSMLFVTLTACSILTGKTFANSIILTAYPTSILPYFYLSLALSFLISSTLTNQYSKHPKKFIIYFKIIYLILIIAVALAIELNISFIAFVGSILILTFNFITGTIPWNYLSELFNFREYKQYINRFQIGFTFGGIFIGLFIGILSYISVTLTPLMLLSIIFATEFFSLLSMLFLSKFHNISLSSTKMSLDSNIALYKNAIFHYFVLLSVASVIITILVDYNLKLELAKNIPKQDIASVINIINFIYTFGILILQMFFIETLLRVLGSKKIIFVYPIMLTVVSVMTFINFNFIWVAALFICNELFSITTYLIARDLYLNILPLALKRVARFKLTGIVKSLATLFSSVVIWKLNVLGDQTFISLLIIFCSLLSIYIAKILVSKYIIQLTQSVYLRHFDPELIRREQVDPQDLEFLINQTLSNSDPEAQLYGVQLLNNEKSFKLPLALSDLLKANNRVLERESAKLLANRREQKQFLTEAKTIISKVADEETRWYLALYVVEYGAEDYLYWLKELSRDKTPASLALVILISLKQGDINQQIQALKILSNMGHSQDIEHKKWFLYILNEFPSLQKENYLLQFINQDIVSLQILAIQRVSNKPGVTLLNSLLSHIGEAPISFALNNCFIDIGESIVDYVEKKFYEAPTFQLQKSCINVLYQLNGEKTEQALMRILSQSNNELVKMMIAKHLAYRSVRIKIGGSLKHFILESMKAAVVDYGFLEKHKLQYKDTRIQIEIDSQMQIIKKSILYFLSAYIGSIDVLNGVSLFDSSKPDKSQQSLVLELIDSTSENKEISSVLMELFTDKKIQESSILEPISSPWLKEFINLIESNNMQSIYIFTRLRKVELFKTLPAETLQVLASCCSTKNLVTSEIIFNEGDEGDGLYIVDSGEVLITKQGLELNRMRESTYFGELALLSDIPRFATAIAAKDSVLLYIDKSDFDRITDENPEIMKNIIKQVIKYLTA